MAYENLIIGAGAGFIGSLLYAGSGVWSNWADSPDKFKFALEKIAPTVVAGVAFGVIVASGIVPPDMLPDLAQYLGLAGGAAIIQRLSSGANSFYKNKVAKVPDKKEGETQK